MKTISVRVKGVSGSGHIVEVTRDNISYIRTAHLMKDCGFTVYTDIEGEFKPF